MTETGARRYFSRLNMNIYVGNLSLLVTEAELAQAFTPFGPVVSVHLMNDEYIGRRQPFGYAYVEMAARADGEAAIKALDGKTINDRAVSLVESLPLSHVKETPPHYKKSRERR